jgi:fido (protein-threonine AMPylation protein)
MFEITGGIPEPIIDELEEAKSPENMAGLHWKSDAAATVIHPLRKGNGRSA